MSTEDDTDAPLTLRVKHDDGHTPKTTKAAWGDPAAFEENPLETAYIFLKSGPWTQSAKERASMPVWPAQDEFKYTNAFMTRRQSTDRDEFVKHKSAWRRVTP
jgi:hypothetical protein